MSVFKFIEKNKLMKTTYFFKLLLIVMLCAACSNDDSVSTEISEQDNTYSTNRLRAYYNLNGNVNESRNGYNATESGLIYETDRNNSPSKAATFNGTGFVTFPDVVRFDPTKSATLAFWIRTGQQSRFDLFDQRTGFTNADQHNHGILFNAGNTDDLQYVYPNYNTNGNGTMLNGTAAISDFVWHHLVFVKDVENSEIRIYLDNQLLSTSSITDLGFEINGSLFLGKNYNETNTFEGNIDDIFIYERALNTSEISTIFNYTE